ncbi:MAG: tetratricopeptide repeat protein [Thermoflexales bacterium]|nr:tetratricopeptide repeat protein [Thermoflexales bacterium]
MRTQLTYARLLLQTRRYKEAETALREALAGDPADADAHALLALAIYRQDRYPEALQEARAAVGLAPDDAYNHYVVALVLLAQDQIGASLAAIGESLRLEPQDPDYHAHLSLVYTRQKKWRKALEAAEAGLRIEPEHVGCANLRGQALSNLGLGDEARQVIAQALARDPENAATHANQGWALLRQSQPEEAFVHFRESLRLNPMSNWARAGIVEAMKARNPLYRWLLRYFLWMASLTSGEQWEVAGGIYALGVMLHTAASASCLLRILLLPLEMVYNFFITLSWVARPSFALALRFDPLGRQALSKEEITASNWLAVCLLAAAASGVGGLWTGKLAWLVPLLVALAMLVPVAGATLCPPGGRRVFLIAYTVLLSQLGLAISVLALTGTPWGAGLALVAGIGFVLGRIAYTWLAIILMVET